MKIFSKNSIFQEQKFIVDHSSFILHLIKLLLLFHYDVDGRKNLFN